MDLLIIRHAPAEDRERFALTGQPDEERPLSKRGLDRMALAARGLTTLALPIERLISSPLVRACQTAEVLAPTLELKDFDTEAVFSPEATIDGQIDWLRKQPRVDALAIVGHEPSVGQLCTALVHGQPNGNMPMKKGGAALIRFEGRIGHGNGRLIWFLPPAVLRALAE